MSSTSERGRSQDTEKRTITSELESWLKDFRRESPESDYSFYSLFASCYFHETWDAIRDDLADGYEDDWLILYHTCSVLFKTLNPKQNKNQKDLVGRFTKIIAPMDSRHEASSFIKGHSGFIVDWAKRLIVYPKPKDMKRHVSEFTRIARGALTKYLKGLDRIPGSSRKYLVQSPSSEAQVDRIIGLAGRTSCGKTTLLCRIIANLSRDYEWITRFLSTSVSAHTTKIPLIVDFHTGAEAFWESEGLQGRNKGALLPDNKDSIHESIRRANEYSGFWFRFAIPSNQRLRVLDLPGVRGFESGPWANRARILSANVDGLILPMDRRFIREEERESIIETAISYPYTRFALALWRIPENHPLRDRKVFFKEKILPWLDGELDELGKARARLLKTRILRTKLFSIAKTADTSDESEELINWLSNVRTRNINQRNPSYMDIEDLAYSDNPDIRNRAIKALVLIGILRALNSAQSIRSDGMGIENE